MNVVGLIRDAAERYRERVALEEIVVDDHGGTASGRSVCYGELYAQARTLCAALQDAGIDPPARLAVLLDNSIEMVVSEWACLSAGYWWVALNVRSSARELEEILDDSRPAVLIVGARHLELIGNLTMPEGCRLITVGGAGDDWSGLLARAPGDIGARETETGPGPDDGVRIRYTSGTSGTPKGAVLPRRCYDASLEAVGAVLAPLRIDDVVLQVAPMTHASGAMLLPHIAVGARALVCSSFDADCLIEIIANHGVTSVFLVPTMLIRVIERLSSGGDVEKMSTLRTIVYGGASMPVDRLITGLDLLGPVFVQIYGLTESTWPVAALSREDHLRRPHEKEHSWCERLQSCGRPTAVGEVRVVDAGGHDVGVAESGELWVRGRNTMSGYWECSGGCSDAKGLDSEGWMHTGDVGYRNAEGYLVIVDRLHDMIVSGGFNVYPREVEGALSSHPAVLESAVVGRPSEEWGETVHAFVVLRPHHRVSAEELSRHCASQISGYKKPRSVDFVDALPKNASGKILRRELRQRLLSARSC